MNWLIPFVWLTNSILLGLFLLKLKRDFELSAKRKAFEDDKKERRRQAKNAKRNALNSMSGTTQSLEGDVKGSAGMESLGATQ